MPYREYCTELAGTIPKLPYPLAQKLINRAWRDIRDYRLWSFLVSTADITTPALISTGTVTVASGSQLVITDPGATAALNPTVFANPPLASPQLGVGRQFRAAIAPSGVPLYSIVGWDGNDPAAGRMLLDRPYTGDSATAQTYQVFKCYYAPPDADFLRYFAITNTRSGYSIRGKRLYYTQIKLNAVDPQRGGMGEAYNISAYKPDVNGRPVHEWYPHPVNAATYNCVYQRRGVDLSLTQDIPAVIQESVLMARAFMHGADWALANVANHPELAHTNWVMFRQAKADLYKEELILAIKQDDEISPAVPWLQGGSSGDFPMGGEFLQSHDLSTLIGF